MNSSMPLENQLLVTKLYAPVTSGPLISRPRLTSLLNESLKYPLTLVSAAAGFGKTTLLASWSQSLELDDPRVAWVSLDEEDNEPRLFWAYVLTALNRQQPGRFLPLLRQLQSSPLLPLNSLLAELINLLVEGTDRFLLVLDDYHVISEQQVHTTLTYLIEHLPPQLHIILSTRTDPALPLWQLRARGQVLEIRTEQLRCVLEETRAFFDKVMDIQLPDETIQEVTTRTEGWLVGLQLLALSLPEQANPATLLQEISGDQRYILDYLTEEVLRQQPQDVQTFLLSTCMLEWLNASLCDAVVKQAASSQQMLQRLEQANLFVASLDSKREWYRYHALFAQALRSQLEQTHSDLVPILHHRASLWYAEHNQTTQAILHALHAKEWNLVADLIERISFQLPTLAWGISRHQLTILQQWLKQLPTEIVGSRPLLCLACTEMLWTVAPSSMQQAWLNAAEATLTASLTKEASSETQQKQRDLLASVIAFRAILQSYREHGETALPLCQQVLSLISERNFAARAQVAVAQVWAYHTSVVNNASAALASGQQAVTIAQTTAQPTFIIAMMGITTVQLLGTGKLNEAQQLTQQAMLLGKQPEGHDLPDVSLPAFFHAEVLREWNQLDAARSLMEEAISLGQQVESFASLGSLLNGYAVQLRVCLSRGELDAACSALQKVEDIGRSMEPSLYLHLYSNFTTVDQVRLWLACGQLDRATRWAEQVQIEEPHGTPFAHEREEVARARIFLAKEQPDLALPRLEFALQEATIGQRWGHVIEIRLLQVLAYHMCNEETKALSALAEAVRLGEPEGYIRSFVEEGAPIEALLYRLRKQNRKHGPTPYLNTLLAAFQEETKVHAHREEPAQAYQLPEPLSEREREALQLLDQGASNLEIAQELAITVDTVKRHMSHIFSKLGVRNRMQAVLQARELGLLDEEF